MTVVSQFLRRKEGRCDRRGASDGYRNVICQTLPNECPFLCRVRVGVPSPSIHLVNGLPARLRPTPSILCGLQVERSSFMAFVFISFLFIVAVFFCVGLLGFRHTKRKRQSVVCPADHVELRKNRIDNHVYCVLYDHCFSDTR